MHEFKVLGTFLAISAVYFAIFLIWEFKYMKHDPDATHPDRAHH